MVDFNKLSENQAAIKAAAVRFVAWREANAALLQGAPTLPADDYATLLRNVNRESATRLDWAKLCSMPDAQFLAEFSGILRHANDDGSFRRGYRPGFPA